MVTCETIIKQKGQITVLCGADGIRYRVRRPPQEETVPIGLGQDARIGRAASATVEQVLCPKHVIKAVEEGFEVIPL